MADLFLYQALHLENRRSGEHRAEHVASGLRVCISDVTRRRLIRVECPVHYGILVPLVLQIVDLVVRVRIRKVQLCVTTKVNHFFLFSNRSKNKIRKTYQIGLYSNNVTWKE